MGLVFHMSTKTSVDRSTIDSEPVAVNELLEHDSVWQSISSLGLLEVDDQCLRVGDLVRADKRLQMASP